MRGCGNKRMVVLAICVFVCAGMVHNAYSNDSKVSDHSNNEELILYAREVIINYGENPDDYDIRIGKEGNLITVQFWPKSLGNKSGVIYGGAGKLYFKIERANYKLIKIEGGQ